MREDLLIVACRSPQPGRVKPRLSPPLNARQAAAAYAAMLVDTGAIVRSVARADAWFRRRGRDTGALRELLGPDARFVERDDDGPDADPSSAFEAGFAAGYRRVVVMGADTPDLPPAYIQTAFDRLREDPDIAVFGPTLDGGVYLAGLSRPQPELFRAVPWHDPTSWLAIRAGAARFGVPLALLPRWQDVDTWRDLSDCLARGGAANLAGLQAAGLLEVCEPA